AGFERLVIKRCDRPRHQFEVGVRAFPAAPPVVGGRSRARRLPRHGHAVVLRAWCAIAVAGPSPALPRDARSSFPPPLLAYTSIASIARTGVGRNACRPAASCAARFATRLRPLAEMRLRRARRARHDATRAGAHHQLSTETPSPLGFFRVPALSPSARHAVTRRAEHRIP